MSTLAKQYSLRSATRHVNLSHLTSQPQCTDASILLKPKHKATAAKTQITLQLALGEPSDTTDTIHTAQSRVSKPKRAASDHKPLPPLKITVVAWPPLMPNKSASFGARARAAHASNDDHPVLSQRATSVQPEAMSTLRQPAMVSSSQMTKYNMTSQADGHNRAAREDCELVVLGVKAKGFRNNAKAASLSHISALFFLILHLLA